MSGNTDLPELALTIAGHQPSRWRSFTNENEILRCCGQDFGNASRKARRGDSDTAWAEYSTHLAAAVLATLHGDEPEAHGAGALESPVEPGMVRYQVEVVPHDWANDGRAWEIGTQSPAHVAQALRSIADQVEHFTSVGSMDNDTVKKLALKLEIERVLSDHPISYELAADPDRPRAVCDGEECDWREPDEFDYAEAEEAHQSHVARQLALKIIADQLNTADVIHVHHHDIEQHAASYNEGYEACMTQHLAEDPTRADDWFEEQLAQARKAALAEAADAMPIDTLHGADGAAMWLRTRAGQEGS